MDLEYQFSVLFFPFFCFFTHDSLLAGHSLNFPHFDALKNRAFLGTPATLPEHRRRFSKWLV